MADTILLKKPGKSQSFIKQDIYPIIILGSLFFIFGFVTWLNAVLIPYLKIACELNNFESYLVAFAFYISYFVMAIPSAWVLKVTGFKKGMAVGLIFMALGALIFIPAALSRTYSVFLLGLFIQGTGLALLQTASNPYITIIGPPESAAKRISIMGVCNKSGGAIGSILLGKVLLLDIDNQKLKLLSMDAAHKSIELNNLASDVILPYILFFCVLAFFAGLIYFSKLPEIDTDHEDEIVAKANVNKTSVFQFPQLVLGILAIFLYVGAEVLAGDTIIGYGLSQGIASSSAKYFTSFTLVAMIVGYIIGIIAIPKYIRQENALKFSAILGLIFSIVAITSSGYVSVLFIALLGLANALMWPSIWPLAIAGLGRFTKIGSSLLIMGIAGAAILPLVYGHLADILNPKQAYFILIPCYLYILYYSVYGRKIRK